MISRLFSACLLLAAAAGAQTVSTEVRMQLVVVEPGGKAGVTRKEFSKQAKPGPGKELRLYVEANRDCNISIAGFTKDGQLVYGVPEGARLQANVPQELPLNKKWKFEEGQKLNEMDVIVAEVGADDYAPYGALLAKMNQPGLPEEVRQAQAGSVREWINTKMQTKTSAQDYSVKDNPGQVGGLVRGELPGPPVAVPAKKTVVVRIRVQ